MFPVAANSLLDYCNKVHAFRVLEADEERELALKYFNNNCLESAKILVLHHLKYVVVLANKYSWNDNIKPDLIQAGNVGLMRAIKCFNPHLGVRLASHAFQWIKNEIFEFLINNHRIMKIATSKEQRKLFTNLHRYKKSGFSLTPDEIEYIANDLKVSQKDVIEMEHRMNFDHNQSIESVLYNDDDNYDSHYQEMVKGISYDGCPTQYIEAEEYEHKLHLITEAVKILNDREQEIIKSRYLTDKKIPFKILAEKLNISIERCRQIEEAAIKKITQAVTQSCVKNL